MKKYLILCASALLALAACSKVAPVAESQHEIGFQVASYATKANVAIPDNTVFGTYSWYTNEAGTTVEQMTNEKVGKNGTEWKTIENTFYWPKTGSIDFISYSPWVQGGPTEINATSLKFTGYSVGKVENGVFTSNGTDLMYADKALNQTENITPGTYYDVSRANGVPTLFHHALANVAFKIQANFLEYLDPADASKKTTWTVTLKSAKLGGVYTKGDLALTSTAAASAWTKPTDDVWTNLADAIEPELVAEAFDLTSKAKNEEPTNLADFGYMIPQKLGATQTLTIVMDIKTVQPNGVEFTQPDVTRVIELNKGVKGDGSAITAWKMNQKIVYTILIKPTHGTNPDNPDDPTDDIITFDPAVASWDIVEGATIQL